MHTQINSRQLIHQSIRNRHGAYFTLRESLSAMPQQRKKLFHHKALYLHSEKGLRQTHATFVLTLAVSNALHSGLLLFGMHGLMYFTGFQ